MKQKLLKTIALGLLALGGVDVAWADDFTPTADVSFRAESTSAWKSGYPIEASETNNEFEVKYQAGLFVLQTYEVTDLADVSSLTLHLTDGNNGADALAIWSFNTTDWSTSTTASTLIGYVTDIVGLAPSATSGTAASTYLLKNTASTTASSGDLRYLTYFIDGTALTTLKSRASGNKFTLLITNKTDQLTTNSQRKFYSSGHSTEAYRPYISATYYAAKIGDTYYTTINAANAAVTADDTEISLIHDSEESSKTTFTYSVNIVPSKAGLTVKRSTTFGNNDMFAIATADKTVTFGSATCGLTIDGQSTTSGNKIVEATNGSVKLVNLTLKNVYTSATQGVVCAKSSGKVYLTDVAFDGCQATATDAGLIFNGTNDYIILSGNNTFTDCTGYGMYLEKRFQIDETNGVSNTTPIEIFVKTANIALGGTVATKANEDDVTRFVIRNAGYGLYKKSGSTRNDLMSCEGYPLEITSAGAATLMLPYASTIPTGVTCYTLTYSSGDKVNATEVTGGTLNADTPVLVNADAGLYYMLNSTKATTATSFNTSDTHTSGALTGVYSEKTIGTDLDVDNHYILNKVDDVVGFYKAKSGLKVGANRAYLTATDVSGARSLSIEYGDGTTGIETMKREPLMDNQYYNLSGQRVSNPTKGLYILNGKKVIIK